MSSLSLPEHRPPQWAWCGMPNQICWSLVPRCPRASKSVSFPLPSRSLVFKGTWFHTTWSLNRNQLPHFILMILDFCLLCWLFNLKLSSIWKKLKEYSNENSCIQCLQQVFPFCHICFLSQSLHLYILFW